ncbi:MAG: hypothetical protein M5U28_46745 [Sandaracinaceae bacterium]|nr:hypothetical protein [Sandaracinaceae bacterium]
MPKALSIGADVVPLSTVPPAEAEADPDVEAHQLADPVADPDGRRRHRLHRAARGPDQDPRDAHPADGQVPDHPRVIAAAVARLRRALLGLRLLLLGLLLRLSALVPGLLLLLRLLLLLLRRRRVVGRRDPDAPSSGLI